MRNRIARALAIATIATAGVGITLTSPTHASATATSAYAAPGQVYGPYSQGTCNYYMNGVRAGGTRTTDCYFYSSGVTCPGGCGYYGWFFREL